MSSQGFQGSAGGGDDKPRPSLSQSHIIPPGALTTNALPTAMVKQTNRLIAPAPSSHLVGAPPVSGHNLITRLSSNMTVLGSSVSGDQQVTVNNQAPVVLPIATSAPTAGTTLQTIPTAVNIQATGTSLIQAAAAPAQSVVAHQPGFRPARTSSPVLLTMPVPVAMSSLIRAPGPVAGANQGAATTGTNLSQLGQAASMATSAVSSGNPQPTPMVHPVSHVPRGAAAASALATPKSTAMAQVLRAHQPQLTSTAVTLTAAAPLLASIPTRVPLPLRTGAPISQPVSIGRSSSPSGLIHPHTEQSHRPGVNVQQTVSSGPGGSTVQFTIQQKPQLGEAAPRQVMPVTQLQAAMATKPVQLSQNTAHATGLTQKVVAQTNPAGITPLQQVNTAQKIVGAQSGYIQRPQRMVMSQAAPTHHATGITKPAVQVNRQSQKIMMTPQPSVTGTLTGSLVQQAMVSPGLNLPQSLTVGRGQKVMVSQIPGTMSSNAPITALAKTVAPIQAVTNTPHTTIAMATTNVATVSSIPIAKVPPQRQIVHSPGQQSMPTPQQGAPAVAQQLTSVIHELSSAITSVTQPLTQTGQAPQAVGAAGVLLPTGARASPVTLATTGGITTAVTLASAVADNRQENRAGLATFPYNVQGYYHAQPTTIVNYPNLMYQQVAAAQNLSFQNTSSLRPGIAVQNSTPNLAATLQAHGVSVATTQGVRVNPPLMVTVDTSRQIPQAFALQPENKGITTTSLAEAPVTTSATAFTNALNQSGVSSTVSSLPSPSIVTNQSASPRPSILRKRSAADGVAVRKNLLTSGSFDSASPNEPGSVPSTPAKMNIHDPARENSQSSTDTASSSESGPHSVTTPELKIKEEPVDATENGPSHTLQIPNSPALSTEASPRKKPRKQLLNAVEELKDGLSSDEEEKISSKRNLDKVIENMASRIKKETEEEELGEYFDDEGVRWTARKERPSISLLNHYSCNWKPRNNHFLRYQDVKPKEERRPTVNELANQRGIQQKASGWRLFHLAAQLEEIMDIEKDVCSKMAECQNEIAPKHIAKHTIEDDIGMVHEITQGNMQRCQLVIDQLSEAKSSMIKILEHKTRIGEIISKHHSKRPVKKKERS